MLAIIAADATAPLLDYLLDRHDDGSEFADLLRRCIGERERVLKG